MSKAQISGFHTERLFLEVNAGRLGLTVIDPPVVTGKSGVTHTFSFLASSGSSRFAFDIYESLTETEVIRSYVKKFDTEVLVNVICTSGRTGEGAKKLAGEYGISILNPDEVAGFFDSLLLKKANGKLAKGASGDLGYNSGPEPETQGENAAARNVVDRSDRGKPGTSQSF